MAAIPVATAMAAFTPRDRDAFMAHWAKLLDDETVVKRTIQFQGQPVGDIVCFGPLDEREVGYWIGREFWGRGIATRALVAFLAEVTTRPLHAVVARHNLASIRVLEKCGFAFERPYTGGDDHPYRRYVRRSAG